MYQKLFIFIYFSPVLFHQVFSLVDIFIFELKFLYQEIYLKKFAFITHNVLPHIIEEKKKSKMFIIVRGSFN